MSVKSKRVRKATLRAIRPPRALHRGSGRPFARPMLRAPRGKTAPWFLRQWGSRPEYKLKQLDAVA